MTHSASGAGAPAAHGGHGSAVLNHPNQSSNWGMSTQSEKKMQRTQSSSPLIVIAISFFMFLALISLPWLLDNFSESQAAKKTEPDKVITHDESANFQQVTNEPVQLQKFGSPRSAMETSQQQPTPSQNRGMEYRRQSVLPPFRPYVAGSATSYAAGNPAPLAAGNTAQYAAGSAGLSQESLSALFGSSQESTSNGEENTSDSSQPGEQSDSAFATRALMPPAMAPNHLSEYAPRQQRQLSPALQAPTEAMMNLLAGKNVSLDSYYSSIYGGTPMQDLAPHSMRGDVMDSSNPRPAGVRQPRSVFERHQMFVMR